MRLTLGVKLTLTSTLLVAIVVAFLGYLHAANIREQHEAWAAERSATFREAAIGLAENSANVLAVSLSEHLQGTELDQLDFVVRQLVSQDARVVFVRLADQRGKILADSEHKVSAGSLAALPGSPAELVTPHEDEARVGDRRLLEVRRPILLTADPGQPVPAPIGVIVIGYDLTPLDAQIAELDRQQEEATRRSLGFSLKVGGLALLAGVLLSLLQALRYSRPIRRLAQTTARIAQGDLSARVAIRQNDEVGTLGDQFNHMADRVQQLLVETVAKAELEHELALAREIQMVLVPSPGTHNAPGLEVAGHYEPAAACGGDFWDLAALPRGRAAILIGDVTGHGVPASILTATAKGCIDTLRHVHGENIQVAETMRVLDRVIHEAGHGTFFMTAAAIVLDATQNALYYAAAAHPPGLLLRWTESGIKLSRLVARGNRLGDGEVSGFEARRIRVVKDDLLVWYTDGLTDAVDQEGRTYTARRLLATLSRIDQQAHPEEVVAHVVADLNAFRGGTPLEDDVTLVVGRVT
ncbi:MAG: HAMP domain-containing protein [Deltaproteobacteria bacterium]|nr:MAG: HAMP domain-containing protein [Deltaproteobacteria bacterium]